MFYNSFADVAHSKLANLRKTNAENGGEFLQWPCETENPFEVGRYINHVNAPEINSHFRPMSVLGHSCRDFSASIFKKAPCNAANEAVEVSLKTLRSFSRYRIRYQDRDISYKTEYNILAKGDSIPIGIDQLGAIYGFQRCGKFGLNTCSVSVWLTRLNPPGGYEAKLKGRAFLTE